MEPAASSSAKPRILRPPKFLRRIAPIPTSANTPGITTAYAACDPPRGSDPRFPVVPAPDRAVVVICSELFAVAFAAGVATTGVKLQFDAPGSPEHDRLTASEKPFCEVMVSCTVPYCPAVSVTDEGLAVTVN